MLKTLAGRQPLEAQKLLTSATELFLPRPEDKLPSSDVPADTRALIDDLLAEIRRIAKLRTADDSARARTVILSYLSKAMADQTLDNARVNEIKARLGQRGELPATLYRLQFRDSLRGAEKRGIKRSHIEDVVYARDSMVEHLLPDQIQVGGYPAVSIYGKTYGETRSRDRFTLLVLTNRANDVQVFDAAWRVYHSDVDVSKVSSLLDLLRAFVGAYGLDISLSDLPREIHLLQDVPDRPSPKPTKLIQVFADITPMPNFEISSFFRYDPNGLMEVAIAFAINLTRYNEDQRRHGVKVVD
jgi:hypothetical protein